MRNIIASILFAMFFVSCNEEPLTSGCNGTTFQTFDNAQFYWVNTNIGTSFLSDEFGLMVPCSGEYINSEPYTTSGWDYKDGLWVITSGDLMFSNSDPSFIHISSFLNGPMIEPDQNYLPEGIEIIRSEYDGIQGFGYNIRDEDGIRIHQPHIPGVPGHQVFKTYEQAMKIALIVSFYIKHSISASINEKELSLMYIEYKCVD